MDEFKDKKGNVLGIGDEVAVVYMRWASSACLFIGKITRFTPHKYEVLGDAYDAYSASGQPTRLERILFTQTTSNVIKLNSNET